MCNESQGNTEHSKTTGRIVFKIWVKISMTESVPDCKLYTWISIISNMHVFLKSLKQLFFETFQNSCFNCLARPIFQSFCKTPGHFAVFAFHFYVGVYSSLLSNWICHSLCLWISFCHISFGKNYIEVNLVPLLHHQ